MEIDRPFAGLTLRLPAIALDFLVIAAYAAILAAVSLLLDRLTGFAQRLNSALAVDVLAFLMLILPVILYFSLQEGSPWQATLGKRRMGVEVVDSRGGRLSLGRALLRSAIKFLPWQLAHSAVLQIRYGNDSRSVIVLTILAQLLVIVYLLSPLLDKQRRAPYDFLAGSRVIRTRSNYGGFISWKR